MSQKLWINGVEFDESYWPDRARRYGDGLFESVAIFEGEMPFIHAHIRRMIQDASYLDIKWPEELTVETIFERAADAGIKNGVLNIWLWRTGEGKYLPFNIGSDWGIGITELDHKPLEGTERGLQVGFYHENQKPPGRLSNIKTCNSLLYIQAARQAAKLGFDDVLIKGTDGTVLESSNSNIFIYLEGQLITPPLALGAINGIMRFVILKLAADENVHVVERPIHLDDLQEASELWLTNAVQGIRWVRDCDDYMFGNLEALRFQARMNKEFLGANKLL